MAIDGWGPAVRAVRDGRLERERRRDAELADYLAGPEFGAVTAYLLGRALAWYGEALMEATAAERPGGAVPSSLDVRA